MLYIAVVLYIRPSLLHFYPFDLRTPRYPPPSLYGGMHYLSTCNDTRFRDVPGADVLGPTTHQEGMIVVRWGCLEPPQDCDRARALAMVVSAKAAAAAMTVVKAQSRPAVLVVHSQYTFDDRGAAQSVCAQAVKFCPVSVTPQITPWECLGHIYLA